MRASVFFFLGGGDGGHFVSQLGASQHIPIKPPGNDVILINFVTFALPFHVTTFSTSMFYDQPRFRTVVRFRWNTRALFDSSDAIFTPNDAPT